MDRIFSALALSILFVVFSSTAIDAGIQNESADRELGQVDLNHNTLDFGGPTALFSPLAVAVDTSVTPNRVYVVDTGNHRVLGYADETRLAPGVSPDLVIGQPDLFSAILNLASPNNSILTSPVSAAVDHAGNLYVSDWADNRVLEYDDPFAQCGGTFPCVNAGAQRVLGQLGSFGTTYCDSLRRRQR
ncbi:MAG TPA: hypothetical protein VKV03_10785 [Candidatus Binataceae bacterium]|nr:hypothetical protein [Candidatus Binataceae bacterium]